MRLDNNLKKAIKIVKKFGGKKIILFGSYLENKKKAQDIDLALQGIKPGYFFIVFGNLLKELKKNVDVINLDDIDSYFYQKIVEKGQILYEK
jgi:predicted nucleotidyltransferase